MKRPQLITIAVGALLVAFLFGFARTVPRKSVSAEMHGPGDGHDHGEAPAITIDTILVLAKKQLDPEQVLRINTLENSISRGDVKEQQLHVYHQLARFWADSARIFTLYAWYTAEAARLENSEKNLTFAAQLFLDNLQQEDNGEELRKWKALQAKELFERSLKINPSNDSAKVGLGAAYLFGGISNPMEGIAKIREVVEKDSANVYAQMTLVKASIYSGQYDKAITRLETVNRLQPGTIETLLLLGDVNERMGNKTAAIGWYEESLKVTKEPELVKLLRGRINDLKK